MWVWEWFSSLPITCGFSASRKCILATLTNLFFFWDFQQAGDNIWRIHSSWGEFKRIWMIDSCFRSHLTYKTQHQRRTCRRVESKMGIQDIFRIILFHFSDGLTFRDSTTTIMMRDCSSSWAYYKKLNQERLRLTPPIFEREDWEN